MKCKAWIEFRGKRFGGVHTCMCDLEEGHEGPHVIEPYFDEDLQVEIQFQFGENYGVR